MSCPHIPIGLGAHSTDWRISLAQGTESLGCHFALSRNRPLYCQTHHFFHRLVCRKHLRFLIAWRITLFSDPMAFVSDSDNSYRWNEMDKRFSVDDTPNEPNRFGWVGEIDPYGYFSENNKNICALYNQIKPRNKHKY